MKKILFLIMAVVMTFAVFQWSQNSETCSAAEYEKLFVKDGVMDIQIEMSAEDWQSILSDPKAEEYKSATVTVNGTKLENVGVRSKGNSSLSVNDEQRYSLRIKFDKYVDGQNLFGLDEIVVNNNFSDPSYMREYLSYEALSSIGATTPLKSFANVSVNGNLYGFYLCLESIDDAYLERNFGEDEGNLYKAEKDSTLVYDENSNYDSLEQKNGDDTEKTGLKNMIQVLNEMPDGEKGNIESVLDVSSALKYIAANTVLGSYDSYNGSMHQNYFLYEHDGKFYVLPWDYNMSFGGFMGSGSSAQTIPIDQPVLNVSMETTPLITNLLEVSEYKTEYYGYIKELLSYLNTFETRVSELKEIISSYVEADPTKFVTMDEFNNAVTYSETTTTQATADSGTMPTDEQMPTDGQMPTPPDWQENGEMPAPPDQQTTDGTDSQNTTQDRQPPDMAGGGNGRGGAGGGMMNSNVSIINFVRSRVENVEKQLSGELSTTGNTTMNNSGGGMGGGMGGPGGGMGGQRGERTRTQQKQISVTYNGEKLTFDQQPITENSRTLVPLRKILETIGATVDWNSDTQTITITKDDSTVILTVGSTTAYNNGEEVTLDAPARIVGSTTLVPVRFISECFGLTVGWDEATSTVALTN